MYLAATTMPGGASSGLQRVAFDTVDRADTGFTATVGASAAITVPSDGWYSINARVRSAAEINGGYPLISIVDEVSGKILFQSDSETASSYNGQWAWLATGTVYLAAGAKVYVNIEHGGSTSTSVQGNVAGSSTFLRVTNLGGAGPAGPTGPTGPTGATSFGGPTGPTGPSNGSVTTVGETAPASPNVGDVWIKTSAKTLTNYGISNSSTTAITNPTNALGAPNDTFATATSTSHLLNLSTAVMDMSLLAKIKRVWIGVRMQVSATTCTSSITCGTGDVTTRTLPALAAPDVSQSLEVELDASLFTPAMLKSGGASVAMARAAGSGTWRYDAAWIRVEWAEPIIGAGAISQAGGSMVPRNIFWWDGSAWI